MSNPLEIFSKVLNLNPVVGKFIGGGLVVLSAAAIVISFGIDIEILVRVGVVLIINACIVAIALAMRGLMARVLAGVVTIAASVFLITFTLQAVTNNALPLMQYKCIVYLFDDSCGIDSEGRVETLASVPDAVDETDDSTTNFEGRVYVQFAGSLDRPSIIRFSQALLADGWPVIGADRGGERTALAAGLREVRYFSETVRKEAEALARSAGANMPSLVPLSVRDLSKTRYGTPENADLLELWISR